MAIDMLPGMLVRTSAKYHGYHFAYDRADLKSNVVAPIRSSDLLIFIGYNDFWTLFLTQAGILCWLYDPLTEVV